jgi:hypothetical protein
MVIRISQNDINGIVGDAPTNKNPMNAIMARLEIKKPDKGRRRRNFHIARFPVFLVFLPVV